MKIISPIPNVTPSVSKDYSQEKALPQDEKSTAVLESEHLQPEQVEISEASRKKLSESEEDTTKNFSTVMTTEEVEAEKKKNESDLDKEIRKLSVEILEITIQIEMLKNKEDKESIKERQTLEAELALKKGTLEAMVDRKLQMTTPS